MDLLAYSQPDAALKFTLQDLDTSYNGTPKMDMLLEIYDSPDKDLWGWIEYRTDLWKRETIENLISHFINIIQQMPVSEDEPVNVSDLDMLTSEYLFFPCPLTFYSEKKLILEDWHPAKTEVVPSSIECVHTRFERIVEQFPQRNAVQFENKLLTYRELNCKANKLAHYLKSKGAGPGKFVVVYMPR